MAESSSRSYRSGESYARGAAAPPAREPANDPLAELARLIGQSDPFADFSPERRQAASHDDDRRPSYGDWASNGHADAEQHDGASSANGHSPDREEPPGFRSRPQPTQDYDDGYEAARDEVPYPDERYHDEHSHQERSELEPKAPSFAPPAESEHGDEAEHDARDGHEGGEYYADDDTADQPYEPEEPYDDAPRRRKHGVLVVVMAMLGLVVLGTAGAFAYRAMFGGAMLPSLPPIIRASLTPSKFFPPRKAEDVSKAAGAKGAASEKLVSREEKPVELKEPPKAAPRVISTIPIAPAPAPAAAAPPAPAPVVAPAPAPAPAPPPVAAAVALPDQPAPAPAAVAAPTPNGEPKKIRTVTIRPDQLGGNAAAAAAAASHGATRSLAAPRTSAAPSPASGENQPLALVPVGESGRAATSDRSRSHALALARTPAAASSSAGGGYAVQLTSRHSEAEAHAAFKALQSKFPSELGKRAVVVRRADLGAKGVYYRAMVGPFASMEEAAGMCSKLKAAGGSCLIQRN